MGRKVSKKGMREGRILRHWKVLCAQHPRESQIIDIMRDVPMLRLAAWRLLRKNGITKEGLFQVIAEVPSFRAPACHMLRRRGDKDIHTLFKIATEVPELRQGATKALIRLARRQHDVGCVEELLYGPHRAEVAAILLRQRFLLNVVHEACPRLRRAAVDGLMRRPREYDLRFVVQNSPYRRREAAALLLKRFPGMASQRLVRNHAPYLQEGEKMYVGIDTHEIVCRIRSLAGR